MPRLLIAATVPATIGAFLLPYARHFRRLGWRVDGVAQGLPGATAAAEFDHAWDVEWSRRLLSPGNLFRAARTMRRILKAGAYDIVHTHTAVASLITRYAVAGMRSPRRPVVIYTAHGFHFNPGGNRVKDVLIRGLESWAGRHTDYLVTINRADEAAAMSLVPARRVVYMPGIGVDCAHYGGRVDDAALEQARRSIGLPQGAAAAVMIAEFSRRKRHADVVRALAGTRASHLHLILVGSGCLMESIRQLAAGLGVQDRVHFTGFQPDIRPWLQQAACLVLPSAMEGLPRSVMEALCSGVPVIGTDIRGTRDLLGDGCGMLFPVGDVERLTEKLDWVAAHPEQARQMGRAGIAAMRRYDIRFLLLAHERLYSLALRDRSAEPAPAEAVLC